MISAGFRTVPDWFAPANKGASVAVGDMTGSGTPDLIVLAVDADGNVTAGWSAWQDVPWFSWENQGGGVAVADLSGNGQPDIVVMAVDNGPEQNRGVYRVGRDLNADANATGGWSDWRDVPGWF